MSLTQSSPDEQTYECDHCGGDRRPSTSVAGSFCSHECHRAHRGQKRVRELFRTLEHDHRYCTTCGRKLKEVIKPPKRNAVGKDIPDWVIGWQHRTDRSCIGERSPRVDIPDESELELPSKPDGAIYAYDHDGSTKNVGNYGDFRNERPPTIAPNDPVYTGTVCNCGNTDHRHEEERIRNRSPFETAYYLAIATRELRTEGKHEVEIDRDRLFDAVLEQALPVEERTDVDIREALAKAVIL